MDYQGRRGSREDLEISRFSAQSRSCRTDWWQVADMLLGGLKLVMTNKAVATSHRLDVFLGGFLRGSPTRLHVGIIYERPPGLRAIHWLFLGLGALLFSPRPNTNSHRDITKEKQLSGLGCARVDAAAVLPGQCRAQNADTVLWLCFSRNRPPDSRHGCGFDI